MLQVDDLDLTRTVAPATETLCGPEVAVLVDAIHARMADPRDVLLGTAV